MINLLPPQEKQILLKEKQFREILILGLVIFAGLSLLGLILAFVKSDLQNKLMFQKEILEQRREEFEISEIKNLEKEVESLNETLLKLNSFYRNKIYLTEALEDLSGAMPPGLYLVNLSCSSEEGKVAISGFAPNREKLKEFKRNLEKKENFKEVYFPPSSWIEATDINFLVSFKLDNR